MFHFHLFLYYHFLLNPCRCQMFHYLYYFRHYYFLRYVSIEINTKRVYSFFPIFNFMNFIEKQIKFILSITNLFDYIIIEVISGQIFLFFLLPKIHEYTLLRAINFFIQQLKHNRLSATANSCQSFKIIYDKF